MWKYTCPRHIQNHSYTVTYQFSLPLCSCSMFCSCSIVHVALNLVNANPWLCLIMYPKTLSEQHIMLYLSLWLYDWDCFWGHSLVKNATRYLSCRLRFHNSIPKKAAKFIFWKGGLTTRATVMTEYFALGRSRTQHQCVFSRVSHKLAISYKLTEFNKRTCSYWQSEFWLTWRLLPSLSCLLNTFLTHSMNKWGKLKLFANNQKATWV